MIFVLLLVSLGVERILTAVTGKLPETVLPQHQKVKLLVDIENTKFSGTTEIFIKCVQDTYNITLHSRWLVIEKVSLTIIKKKIPADYIEITRITHEEETDFIIISLKTTLEEENEYRLNFQFQGKISENSWGFFYGSFTDLENKQHMFAATHFEPTFARQAFPCFDEPAMKSTFEISIGIHQLFMALSNMPLVNTEPVKKTKGWIWNHFDVTPKMSSYLVAFVIFDDGYAKVTNGSICIWARNDTIHLLNLALENTPKYLRFFEEYFGTKYDMPKTDIIALTRLPAWASAMENWGLVTFTEEMILNTASHDIFSITKMNILAHELAHMWFGNLVTMKCWGQVWLKESFATYFSLVAINEVMADGLFEIEFTKNHMTIIQYNGTRALDSECVWDHARAKSLLDGTTYLKGGPILRMTQYFLDFRDLKKSMFYIFSEHSFCNYDSDDLILSFQKSFETSSSRTVIPLKDIMSSWFDKPGFPLVEVNRILETGIAIFKQRPFYANSYNDAQCWWIPITFTSLNNLNNLDLKTKIWMTCPREEIRINGLDSAEWLLLNVQMSGLFVVKYDEVNWNLLSNTLRQKEVFERIPSMNRFQLVFDRLLLALHGNVSYSSLLETLLYLKHEKRYAPWKPAVDFFIKLKHWLDDEPELVGMYVRNLTQPHYTINKTYVNVNSVVEMSHYSLIVKTACDFNLTECLRDMFDFYKQYKKSNIHENPIPKELRSIVYCLVLERGKESDVNVFQKKFQELMSSPICDPDEYLFMQSSFRCLKKKTVTARSTYYSEYFSDIGDPPILKSDDDKESIYQKIQDKDPHFIAKRLPGLADQLYTITDLEAFQNFVQINKKKLSIYQDSIEDCLRRIRANIRWKKLYAEDVKKILKKILNITKYTTENITENITENFTENITKNITENITENFTENITKNITESINRNIAEDFTKYIKSTTEKHSTVITFRQKKTINSGKKNYIQVQLLLPLFCTFKVIK